MSSNLSPLKTDAAGTQPPINNNISGVDYEYTYAESPKRADGKDNWTDYCSKKVLTGLLICQSILGAAMIALSCYLLVRSLHYPQNLFLGKVVTYVLIASVLCIAHRVLSCYTNERMKHHRSNCGRFLIILEALLFVITFSLLLLSASLGQANLE